MSNILPQHLLEEVGQPARRFRRMRVEVGGLSFQVLRLSNSGFVLDSKDAPALRGLVNLYDGPRHLYQCLVVAGDSEHGETAFEFKRRTPPLESPPLDFVPSSAPAEPAPC